MRGPPASAAPPRAFGLLFLALCGGAIAVLLFYGLHDDASRWAFANRCDGRDAVTYYFAALASLQAISPYDLQTITAQFQVGALFVYPLFTLPLFYPLLAFDPDTALLLLALLRLACLAGLVRLWSRLLPVDWRWQLVFLPVGLGGAAVHDLCSANVVAFEALALWLGIGALWRGGVGSFAGWIGVAALPKLSWLALLPLALQQARSAWRAIALVLGAAAALFALWIALWPDSFGQWFAHTRMTATFRYNIFTLLRTVVAMLGGDVTGAYVTRIEAWGYGLWIGLVALVLLQALRRGIGLRSLTLLALASLLAVWPGNLSYSWLPLLPLVPVVAFFLSRNGMSMAGLMLAVLCLWPQPLLDWTGPGNVMGQGAFVAVAALWASLAVIVARWPDAFEAWLGGGLPATH